MMLIMTKVLKHKHLPLNRSIKMKYSFVEDVVCVILMAVAFLVSFIFLASVV
jgi:hypothetical protein